MKYVVNFSGFHYVEADSIEEAKQKAMYDEVIYSELQVDLVEEVDEFTVDFTVDMEELM